MLTGGIRQPLLVRPVSGSSDEKYGIVCGSRRFNAAIEAGLTEVPCLIENLNDMEAMSESLIENRQRKPSAIWMEIEFIGMMHQNNLDMDEIIKKVSISKSTVDKYIRISNLPEELKGLLRES